jgi:hypothetical protein
LEIINELRSEENCWAVYGQTLNAIKMETAQQCGWSFQHVSRMANKEAHRLAQLAFVYGEGREWRADFPFYVEEMSPVSM